MHVNVRLLGRGRRAAVEGDEQWRDSTKDGEGDSDDADPNPHGRVPI
ncbi:hypothetical protein K7640_01525 [Micromonospora sp. PLK6-60]|nr:hypothetical protein [Micromonospora sp. PLK6-60]MBY8870519.1 hypothetical protein [Micromonospora sp. PLK6-60]